MIKNYIKKYKIKKTRIPQVKELFEITKDPRLSTFIINSTKGEPELVDYLISSYKERSKNYKVKEPAAFMHNLFQTLKIDYISQKKISGREISKEQIDHFINMSAKIITLINSTGDKIVIEVIKDDKGTKFIYKDTINSKYE